MRDALTTLLEWRRYLGRGVARRRYLGRGVARRRYLVAYDIRDPARLRAIHKTMKAYGQALQYSVFVSDLDGIERMAMIGALQERMKLSVDSVVIVDLGAPTTTGTSSFQFIGVRLPLPRSGPTIV